MHGDGGLARAGPAHHAEYPRVLVADGGGLLRLNGGDNLTHVAAGGLGEQVEEDTVVYVELGIDIVFEAAILHAVLALERHFAAYLAGGTVVAAGAGHGIVVQRTDRRAPVVYQHLVILAAQAVENTRSSVRRLFARLGKIDAREKRRHQHALVALGEVVGERLAHKIAVPPRRRAVQGPAAKARWASCAARPMRRPRSYARPRRGRRRCSWTAR